ncbi:MAG: TIM barrel protein [Clostridiales Family XIII bacterium]|jgi:sugar phosphate isomerase/epimerase/alkylhydroperoxidase/carboxymuconolactone decarboxylase family protein YurZ|nr:TIM barrel protein [Clostridiales Family XIII bacterium]
MSIEYGVFSTAFGAYGISEIAERLALGGIKTTQFYPLVGGEWLGPEAFTEKLIREINVAFAKNRVDIVAVGAGNRFVSANVDEAKKTFADTKKWIEIAAKIGAKYAVIEAGTTHRTKFWTDTADNHSAETWRGAVRIFRQLAKHAQKFGVTIGIEPHHASVVRDAAELRKIIDDVGEPNFKAVIDPANSITKENAQNQNTELETLFQIIGDDFVLAHAKDAKIVKGNPELGPAGTGVLPYGTYIRLLKDSGYKGPLLLEYTGEDFSAPLRHIQNSAVPPFLRPLAEGDPVLYDAVQRVQDIHHGTAGSIPLKYRLLLTVVADTLALHPAGAVACAKEALAAGATREQIAEAIRVAYAAGGLPPVLESIDIYKEVIIDGTAL